MRSLTLSTVALVVVSLARAQSGAINAATMSPIRAMPAPVGATPYGNILFPGGTPSHPVALGGTVSGSIPYTGARPGYGGMGRNRTMVIPYAVPVYAGGYGYGYGGGYEQPQVQNPNITVVMPQQPTPTVIINNHYSGVEGPRTSVGVEEQAENTGGVKVYEATPRRTEAAAPKAEASRLPAAYVRDDKPNIFLIAMNDRTVKQAIGYWVKGGNLHYVTPQATIGEVPLTDVDREASVKLNAERKLDFDLAVQ